MTLISTDSLRLVASAYQRAGHREADKHGGAGDRHSRIIQVGEAILLALVTLTAAWAGLRGARWGTASPVGIAQSSKLRNLATRDDLAALSLPNFGASTFNAWFIAFTLNNPQKEAIAERRFRPEIRVAFNAWMATNLLRNPDAPPGPRYMPQYKLPAQAQADALDSVSQSSPGDASSRHAAPREPVPGPSETAL